MNITKQEYYPVMVKWVESNGFERIRANIKGFEKPIAYEKQSDSDKFTPDATGYLMFEKSYFEIVLKTDDTERLATKLKLMSLLAAQRGGKLYVIAPKGHYLFGRKILKENNIYGTVVKIKASI